MVRDIMSSDLKITFRDKGLLKVDCFVLCFSFVLLVGESSE